MSLSQAKQFATAYRNDRMNRWVAKDLGRVKQCPPDLPLPCCQNRVLHYFQDGSIAMTWPFAGDRRCVVLTEDDAARKNG